MANFFEDRRDQLGLSQREMAQRLRVSNTAVGKWEIAETIPRTSVAALAIAYEVSESRMEKEVMAQRRVIEERHATVAK